MRFLVKISAMILFLTISGGCQSKESRLNPWIGQHYSKLLGSWGTPQQIIDDGTGGKVIIYAKEESFLTSTRIKKRSDQEITITPTEKIGHVQESVFRTDPNGVIISVSVNYEHF